MIPFYALPLCWLLAAPFQLQTSLLSAESLKQVDDAAAVIRRLSPEVSAWRARPEAADIGQAAALIQAYGQVGRTQDAEALFAWLCRATPLSQQWLEKRPEFAAMRAATVYPRLSARVQQETKLAEKLWGPSRYPFEETLSVEKRLYGLSLVWSEIKYGFPHFDKVPELDWNQAYQETIPQVIAAENTLSYYRVLKRLVARLKEGHTHIAFPWELVDRTRRRPAFRTDLVENRVLVTELADDAALPPEIRVGTEITAIDGIPVMQYAETNVVPYFRSSTPQGTRLSVFQMGLLEGPLDQPIQLQVVTADGATREVRVTRGEDHRFQRPAVTWRRIGEMGYLAVNTFGREEVKEAVAKALTALKDTKGLIIDVRKNGGGNSGWWMVGHLAETYHQTQWATRSYRPVLRPWGMPRLTWYEVPAKVVPATQQPRYRAPVVVLSGAYTASAAEDFLASFQASGRGVIFGEASAGATGQPMLQALPGGGYVRFCVKRDRTPTGQAIVGRGIVPNRTILATVEDIRTGFDRPLEAALTHLAAEAAL